MLWGTYRALVNCSVIGVTFGFRHQLELLGLGYKLAVINGMVVFKVGASHEIFYKIPAACLLKVITPTRLLVKSIDASRAGSITSSIYELRKPDAYKGKGIRWDVKSLFLKEGKKQK
jgi:large subunit ribosomal protein L6